MTRRSVLQTIPAALACAQAGSAAEPPAGRLKQSLCRWCYAKIPLDDSLSLIFDSLRHSGRLVILEEHVSRGGLAELLCRLLLESGIPVQQVVCRAAQGYPDGLYGSQAYHRERSSLDVQSLSALFAGMGC